jgi:hypothetical protein
MGYSNWSNQAYSRLSGQRKNRSRDQIFDKNQIDDAMDPDGIDVRESRDSDAHPESNAIIVGFDVTGSMGAIPEQFAKEKLGGLMRMLVDEDYIEHPQVLFAGIGDAYTDQAPFQVGQFESGLEMDMWLTRMWLEGGGGGQKRESYGLTHWFAARHTSIDCYEKRGKKGYLFTMGDEMPWDVTADQIQSIFGYTPPEVDGEISIEELVELASRTYEVFHIVVAEGSHGEDPEVRDRWNDVLGERALVLPDAGGVCELIGTTVGVFEQTVDLDDARDDLSQMGVDSGTLDAVSRALEPIAKQGAMVAAQKGAVMSSEPASGDLPTSDADDDVERL